YPECPAERALKSEPVAARRHRPPRRNGLLLASRAPSSYFPPACLPPASRGESMQSIPATPIRAPGYRPGAGRLEPPVVEAGERPARGRRETDHAANTQRCPLGSTA